MSFAAAWLIAKRFLKPVISFLAIGVTIPVWIIIGIVVWFHFDKSSDIRTAVDRAVTDLVAGEEIAAANARAEGEARLRRMALDAYDKEVKRREAVEGQLHAFADSLSESNLKRRELGNETENLLSRPVPDGCVVDDDLFGRLRDK